ncbi:MAG: SPOR domain-containing protein [Novosphingobium sp.]
MVISAADGGPEEGRNEGQNEGLPINPESWQDHAEHQAHTAEDRVTEAGQAIGSTFEAAPQTDRLALGDEERLPWLESADDVDYDEPASDSGRMLGFVIFAVLLLFALVGGIFWVTHRNSAPAAADGSLIAASTEPYKVAPKNPGGKTFEGTGDASFKVSEGEKPAANLAGSAAPAAKPATLALAAAGAKVAAPPAGPTSGVGVQIGAFSTNAAAEAAWSKLAAAHAPLTGLSHRVIEGKADMATVFRLQAVAGDLASANALCGKLQSGGLKCQVKR